MNTTNSYRLTDDRAAAKVVERILNDVPHDGRFMVEIREAIRTRSTGQNSRFWATLTEELRQLSAGIAEIAAHTGYTPLEVRRIVAKELQPEQVAILYAGTPEAVHDILKTINGIPTSTRLGTKKFMEYEERMVQTIAEVVGAVQAVARVAA
jgi:hypothetical protein